MLRNGLTKLGIKVPYEAIDQLFNVNKLNRNDINSGLEKLELITKDKKLDSETFSSLFNTTSSFDAFEISNALLSGDKKALNKILSSFYHFSINFNEVLGPLKYKINKLIDIYEYNENETKIAVLVDTYKPPIFWKEKSIIQTQLSKWNKNELDTLLDKINEIEILCKLNYEIAETIFNKERAPPKSPIYGQQIYELSRRRGELIHEMAVAGMLCKKSCMYWVFYSWKYIHDCNSNQPTNQPGPLRSRRTKLTRIIHKKQARNDRH